MFLDAIRGSTGREWDLANCFHCPTFIVLGRGFGTGYESPPLTLLTLWSIPAVQMARVWGATSQQLELSPLAFVGALFLQWGIFGLVVRASMQMLVTRRPARA
ncbi:MAG: hypothetical protein AB7N24_23855 [Dehalococcoidia bacterium]